MAAAAVAEPRGLKRICPTCGTRYYDLNKRPIICPSCTTEFKSEIKSKGRKSRLAAANDELAKVKPAAKVADDADVVVADGDEEVVSLTDVELEEEAEDEDLEALDPDLTLDDDDDAEGVDDEEDEDLEDVVADDDDKA